MPKILLTGGSGFLGKALLRHQAFDDAFVVGRTRPGDRKNYCQMNLDRDSDYSEMLVDIDVVVHLAARAHVMDERCDNPLEEYRNINTFTTLNLAEQAARNGVKRFIFISSIKVLGEQTEQGCPFSSDDPFNPQDPYAVSKAEAEIGLQNLTKRTNMELVIIRPPLVYGRDVKGNFAKLLKLAALPIPLPFGSIKNKRSLVSIENLIDLICICLEHEKAKNQIFLVSDDFDLSTPDLLAVISSSGNFKSRLFNFSPRLLLIMLSCVGKSAVYNRLCGSMQIDLTHTKNQLNWEPPFSPKDCILNCWSDPN